VSLLSCVVTTDSGLETPSSLLIILSKCERNLSLSDTYFLQVGTVTLLLCMRASGRRSGCGASQSFGVVFRTPRLPSTVSFFYSCVFCFLVLPVSLFPWAALAVVACPYLFLLPATADGAPTRSKSLGVLISLASK
jgi:hypothetical protein